MRPKVQRNILSATTTTATGDILDSVSSRVHYAAVARASLGVGGKLATQAAETDCLPDLFAIYGLLHLAEQYPDGVTRRLMMIRR